MGIRMEIEGSCKQHTTIGKNFQIKYSGEKVYVCTVLLKMTKFTETKTKPKDDYILNDTHLNPAIAPLVHYPSRKLSDRHDTFKILKLLHVFLEC